MRYEPALGFNTKQWWVYDNDKQVWIDPPTEVLDSLPRDVDKAEDMLYDILELEPDWLNDEDYWYDGNMDI